MSIDLSKIDAKIKKLEQWKQTLSEMLSDTEGSHILNELLSSPNGNNNATAPFVAPATTIPMRFPRLKSTKQGKLEAAILEGSLKFTEPFEARQLMNQLLSQSFHFSRSEPMLELGVGLRKLVAANRLRVVREKVGRVGRLYEKVLP
jgi:hypothetical protein